MSRARDLAAAGSALRWLRTGPDTAAARELLPLADEAWFYEMLLLRSARRLPGEAAHWARRRDELLDAAQRLDPLVRVRARPAGESGFHEGELVGASMLAHLLRLRRPGVAAAERFIARALGVFAGDPAWARSLPPLHALCLVHNLTESGEAALARSLRPPRDADAASAGLSGPERLLAQAYFHTHVVLFAFGTFRRIPENPSHLADSFAFVREHAAAVVRYGWADLCAEFAICLALRPALRHAPCGERDDGVGDGAAAQDRDLMRRLIDALHRLQLPEGHWSHPYADARQDRHSTMMAALALLETAGADQPVLLPDAG